MENVQQHEKDNDDDERIDDEDDEHKTLPQTAPLGII